MVTAIENIMMPLIIKGENKKTFAYYEEIPHLKVDEYAAPAFLYKRCEAITYCSKK